MALRICRWTLKVILLKLLLDLENMGIPIPPRRKLMRFKFYIFLFNPKYLLSRFSIFLLLLLRFFTRHVMTLVVVSSHCRTIRF